MVRPIVGSLIGLGLAFLMRSCWLADRHSKAPVLWLADRDGGAVIALDHDRIPVLRHEFQRPLKLLAASDHTLWVYGDGRDRKPWLAHLDRFGALRSEQSIEALLDWCSLEAGAVLALLDSPLGVARLVRIEADGKATEVEQIPGAEQVAAAGKHWVVACNTGRLLFRSSGTGGPQPIEGSRAGARTKAAAQHSGARDPTCWEGAETEGKRWIDLAFDRHEVLWALGEQELMRFDSRGRVLAKRALASSAIRQATSSKAIAPAATGVWVLAGARQALHFDNNLRITQSSPRFALGGAAAIVLGNEEGPRVALPGALLAFDERGRELAGQGGFRHLVDLAYCDASGGL